MTREEAEGKVAEVEARARNSAEEMSREKERMRAEVARMMEDVER